MANNFIFHAVFSDSGSVLTDVSDTASSSPTNVISSEKRHLGAFIDDGEESSPMKKVKTDSGPVPLFAVEVTYKEVTMENFIFPISFDLSELKKEVAQMFSLESTQFTLKYLDEEDELISILADADLKFAISDSDMLYKNMGFNESGQYKKTFIGSGENVDQGAGLQEVQTQEKMDYHLARDREQHLACELFGYREDNNKAAFAVAVVEKIYAHESLTFNNTVACEVIFKWKAVLKDDMDGRSDVYVLSNGCRKCSDDSDGYYWEYTPGLPDKAKGNVLGMKFVREQSGNTLRVSQSKFYNGKLVQTLLEGHLILSLEGSLSGDCDVEKK
ncbi:zinc finger, CCHC-type containing protein [Tanacetum coccineum]